MLLAGTAMLLAVAVSAGRPIVGPAAAAAFLVQANERPSDIQLQAAVSQALQNNPLTATSLIVVHVSQGEVTLEGAASSALARREATRLAETVLGVRDIRNRLSVVSTPQTAEVPPPAP